MPDHPDAITAWLTGRRYLTIEPYSGGVTVYAISCDTTPCYQASGVTVQRALAALARGIEDTQRTHHEELAQ